MEYITANPKETKRLIGIDYQQLQQLIAEASSFGNQQETSKEKTKVRIIQKGGGRKPKLAMEEQILLTLVYLHHIPTFQVLGIHFGVSESTAHNVFHYWIEILSELLPASLLDEVKKKPVIGNGLKKYCCSGY